VNTIVTIVTVCNDYLLYRYDKSHKNEKLSDIILP